jgi:HSP20 family protein
VSIHFGNSAGIRLDFHQWNGYIFKQKHTSLFSFFNTLQQVKPMPRSGGRKPSFAGHYNRHLDEMRSLLRTLDPLAAEDEGSLAATMDIYETDRDLVLEFDLPGVSPENISLTQRGMVFVIQVEKLSEQPQEQVRYLCLERHFGRLRRTVKIPDLVDPTHIHAEYSRGVLRIICPKGSERRIVIKELVSE